MKIARSLFLSKSFWCERGASAQRVLPFIALRRVEIKYGGITGAAEVMEIRRGERGILSPGTTTT
jgi:hypothetical protein